MVAHEKPQREDTYLSEAGSVPLVAAVLLTADRQEFTRRAEYCFFAQSYKNSILLIVDSGEVLYEPQRSVFDKSQCHYRADPGTNIGYLRNFANERASEIGAEIIMHFDSDDRSYPSRISEQVAALQALKGGPDSQRADDGPPVDLVGSREMMFWDSTKGEAWLYKNDDPRYVVSTSMCYWLDAWKRVPFPDVMIGSEQAWAKQVTSVGLVGRKWVVGQIHESNVNNYRQALANDDPHSTARFWRAPERNSEIRAFMEGS